jgi:predicted lactoylglutathione lyase
LHAGSRAELDRFRDAALGAGGSPGAEGHPRYREEVHAARVRDPEGNVLDAVFAT